MEKIFNRMLRAAKLDVKLYEEVEADSTATQEAMIVVIMTSVAAGISSIGIVGIGGLILGTIIALVCWYIWAALTYFIGTKLLAEPQTKTNMGELLRVLGYSSAPGVIRILGIVPALFNIVSLIAGIWQLVAMVVAVRQALDYKSIGRAVAVCFVGWVVQAFCLAILMMIAGLRAV